MKNLISLLLTVLLLNNISFAQQAPPAKWMKCYGGGLVDDGWGLCHASNGDIVAIGSSNSQDGDITSNKGGTDCWIVRLDSAGNIRWQKNIGGSATDVGKSIINTTDGGFIVALTASSTNGDCQPNRGSNDFGVVKLDSNGNVVWAKSFGGSLSDNVMNNAPTLDGGCILIGYSLSSNFDVSGNYGSNDVWVVKLDAAGNLQWNRNYGGSDDDRGNCIRQTADGGYIFSAQTSSNAISFSSTDSNVTGNHGSTDAWVVKLNDTGAITWQKAYGGYAEEDGHWIEPTTDGGYIISSRTRSNDGDITVAYGSFDIWVAKINATGSITWQKTYGGSDWDGGFIIVKPVAAGGYIMAAGVRSADWDVTDHKDRNDIWIVRLNSMGSIIWKKSYGGTGDEGPTDILPMPDFGYAIIGLTASQNGDVSGNHGAGEYWIVRLGTDSTAIPTSVQVVEKANIKIWPTLTSNTIQVQLPNGYELAEIMVMDMMGRNRIHTKDTGLERTIDMTELPVGNYILYVHHKGIKSIFRISRF